MKTAASVFADFVTALRYEDIPADVVEKTKACLIDTVAACVYGVQLPWSKAIVDYCLRNSADGEAGIIGACDRVRAPWAALANGSLAHSFELDAPVHPSVGVHPGPGCIVPGLAVAQEEARSGREFITAFVAGFEAMHRMAATSPQSCEKKGFHAPGLFGVFGGAMTAARLMRLDVARTLNAIGISGSLCSGLLEFSHSGGGMVKRLHPGRAAEGGVMAASLAREDFTGPTTVIEGEFGFLKVFCSNADLTQLDRGLGTIWQTLTISHKRYAAHGQAHVPMTAALALKDEYELKGEDIAAVTVHGNEKIVTHHDIKEPREVGMAQYSVPFCMAVALLRDPMDPSAFSEQAVNDPAIRALTRNVSVAVLRDAPPDQGKASRVTITLKNGRALVKELHSYPGMPEEPFSTEELREKFDRLTGSLNPQHADRLFQNLLHLEEMDDLRNLEWG